MHCLGGSLDIFLRKHFCGNEHAPSTKNKSSAKDTVSAVQSETQPNKHQEGRLPVPEYLLPSNSEQSILVGDIKKYVELPLFVSREEWIASHG